MCLAIHSDTHINITHMYEQNFPSLKNNKIKFTECYDIILQNHGQNDIDKLYILSPHNKLLNLNQPALFNLKNSDNSVFDWIFKSKELIDDNQNKYKLSPLHEEPNSIDVIRLKPKIRAPYWLDAQSNPLVYGSFLGLGFMMAEITFEDNAVIKPFDPNNPDTTTYWIRLCYEPRFNFLLSHAIFFKINEEMHLKIQPCSCLGPKAVLEALGEMIQTNCIPEESSSKDLISEELKRLIYKQTFISDKTSTTIENHYISLLTSDVFMVLNPHSEGPCGFLGLDKNDIKSKARGPLTTRTWFSGTRHYKETDPFELSDYILSYLGDWAGNPSDAKAKEEVSTALGLGAYHNNVCHIMEALKQTGYLKSGPNSGTFTVHECQKAQEILPFRRSGNALDISNRKRYAQILDALYSKAPIPSKSGKYSRFLQKPFRIQFELLYSQQKN